MKSDVLLPASSLISVPITFAPWRAKRVAIALPFPKPSPMDQHPDTMAILSFRSNISKKS